MEFPLNPTQGQQYSLDGRTWQWDGTVAAPKGVWGLIPVSQSDVDAVAAAVQQFGGYEAALAVMGSHVAASPTLDQSAAMQAILDAAKPYSKVTFEADVVWTLASPVYIRKPLHVVNRGVVNATGSAVLGTALFQITSSNVRFENKGLIDGQNTTFSGIAVMAATSLYNVHLKPGRCIRFNPTSDSTSQFTVLMDSVIGGSIGKTRVEDAGGYGVYTQFCQGLVGRDIQTLRCNYTGVNASANLDCDFHDVQVRKTGYFGIKGGYGLSASGVTADVAPSLTQFSITKNAGTAKQWKEGIYFLIIRTNQTAYYDKVRTIEDRGSYYLVTVASGLEGVPVAGDTLELVDNTKWHAPLVEWTGDNGFDFNIVGGGGAINDAVVRYAGEYMGFGNRQMLGAAIWLGADGQGPGQIIQCFQVNDFSINRARTENSAGSGICIMAAGKNVWVRDPVCLDYAEQKHDNLLNPEYGGIEINRTTYAPCRNVGVINPVCRSKYGYGVLLNYALYGLISGGDIQSAVGIIVRDSIGGVEVVNPRVVTSLPGAAALDISKGSLTTTGVSVAGVGRLSAQGAGSIAFKISADNATDIMLGKEIDLLVDYNGVAISNATPNLVFRQENARAVANAPRGLFHLGGNKDESFEAVVAPGATQVIATVAADNGTCGSIRFTGDAWGNAGLESFDVRAAGHVFNSVVRFASLDSPNTSSFLAAGDFTTKPYGGNLGFTLSYTNNETAPVHISGSLRLNSRAN